MGERSRKRSPKCSPSSISGALLGEIFVQKSQTMFKWSSKGAKNRKKRHLKFDAKNDAEQYVKSMPKGYHNCAKIDVKINENQHDF